MIAIIDNFPSQVKAMASRLFLCNEGPFPLDHDDFLYSNIMVDENSFDTEVPIGTLRSLSASNRNHAVLALINVKQVERI